jgi:lysozyme
MVDLAKLTADLNSEEGRRKSAYRDSLGYWTIGVGRLIDARLKAGLRDPEIDLLLANDLQEKLADIQGEPWFLACAAWEPRQRALLDWYFQLGHHVYGFVATLQAIANKDFAQAARRMRQSLWHKQTPARAERVIRKIENGTD